MNSALTSGGSGCLKVEENNAREEDSEVMGICLLLAMLMRSQVRLKDNFSIVGCDCNGIQCTLWDGVMALRTSTEMWTHLISLAAATEIFVSRDVQNSGRDCGSIGYFECRLTFQEYIDCRVIQSSIIPRYCVPA